MRGKLIWFNADKGFGFIRTEDEERLLVRAEDFLLNDGPVGRCGGTVVAFERRVAADGVPPRAVDVVLVTEAEPRRARNRAGRAVRR